MIQTNLSRYLHCENALCEDLCHKLSFQKV